MDTSTNNGPENMGQALNQARIRRRLSVDQVSEALHIRREYLLALEQNRWEDLPGEVYGQGFLRNYARYLELDGDALVEQRRKALGQPLDHPVLSPMEPIGRTGLYAHASPRATHRSSPSRIRRQDGEKDMPEYSNPRLMIWVVGVLVVLFLGGLWLLQHYSGSVTSPLAEKSPPKLQTSVKGPAKSHKARSHPQLASPTGVKITQQSASQSGHSYYAQYAVSTSPVTIALSFTGTCWVSASVDGGPAMSKLYYAGQSAQFSGSHDISLTLGSHALTMMINGQAFALPTANDVLNLSFQGS
ncbi:MAG: DUF4115 domain-containing protein [Sulfobacillus thermotolerans]|nr:DUF4115 domain-containing protein [Sulfobacillus thermotolerans]